MSIENGSKNFYLHWWIKFLEYFSVGLFDPHLEKPIQNKCHVALHLTSWIFLQICLTAGTTDAQNLNEMVLDLTASGSIFLSAAKFMTYCRYRHTIHKLIRIIEIETIVYTKTDRYIIKAITGTREILINYILSGTLAFGCYLVVASLSKTPEHLEGDNVKMWEIVHFYVPYDLVIFERFGILRIILTILLLYHGYCLMFLDIFTSSLLTHVGRQFEATAHLFASINFSASKENAADDGLIAVSKGQGGVVTPEVEIKKAVEYHRLVLRCSEDLQRVFSGVFMLQIIGSCTPLCFCMFLVLQTIKSHENYIGAMGHIAYLIFLMYQLYMVVRCADITTERASSVADGVYMSNWNLATPSTKRQLAWIIQRAQYPVAFSALGVFPVTIKTFISIMKGAYTALTLMSNMD